MIAGVHYSRGEVIQDFIFSRRPRLFFNGKRVFLTHFHKCLSLEGSTVIVSHYAIVIDSAIVITPFAVGGRGVGERAEEGRRRQRIDHCGGDEERQGGKEVSGREPALTTGWQPGTVMNKGRGTYCLRDWARRRKLLDQY